MAKREKIPSGESEIARKFKQNPGLYIGSVVILVLVTVVFLAGDLLSPKNRGWDNTFGYYDKAPISWVPDNIFNRFQRSAVQNFQSQGYDIENQWIMAQVWRQAYEATVEHIAILQIMKRSNYHVPVKTVDRQVARLPDFQENGRFSASLYNRMSESSRLAIWRQTQEEIIKNLYASDFFDGLLMNNAEAEFIGSLSSPERNFKIISINVDDYPESEFLAYADANANLFDSIHLSRIIVIAGEREAKKILDTIQSGTITFEDAARAHSQDGFADRGGDMGIRYNFDLEKDIPSLEDRNKVINLRNGEISPVIKVGESWVIYRAEDNLIKADFQDETVMERVRFYLRNFDRGRMEDWAIEQANEFASMVNMNRVNMNRVNMNSLSFEDAARAKNLNVYDFGPFPLVYGVMDIATYYGGSPINLFSSFSNFNIPSFDQDYMKSLSKNENFWKIAFSTPLQTPSEPLVQGNNVLVLLPTEEINVEETTAKDVASMYLSYWMSMLTEQSMRSYFLGNPRMDDRFWQVYTP
ncbi:MAG: peptidylprolyl isomerase [Treponema sp.]|jgi:hypothetical protein|nr:peptidylprolyl isomerase [Treponema sp.]